MLSKVYPGHSFYHACRYVVNKPGAEVLEYNGVRGHDYKMMSDDFIMQQQLRPEKEKACFHCSLSFYPGEVLSNEELVKIAKEYLDQLGLVNTQYAITKHTDRRHLHLHLLANMVDNNGKAITDSFLGLRGKKIAQQLTKQYNLIPAINKNLEQTNFEALRKSEANKYKVYKAIIEALPKCRSMEDLERKLQIQGIETQYKFKGQTTERQGISFKIGEDCFKGSQVDRKFSLANLQKTIALDKKQLGTLKPEVVNTYHAVEKISKVKPNLSQEAWENKTNEGVEKVMDILMKPQESMLQVPHELLKKNKRKKKNSKRQH
jgi:hypothetical protein